MGAGSTKFPMPRRKLGLRHPSNQTRRFWFARFTYLRRVNERFDCWSDTFCAAFFTGPGLGFALATARLAALATLRALPRLAVFPFGSFPRF
jgi:hypothetical protein